MKNQPNKTTNKPTKKKQNKNNNNKKNKKKLGKARPSFKKPEVQITSHQTQSGHCHRAFRGWRLLLNSLLLCVEECGSWSPSYGQLSAAGIQKCSFPFFWGYNSLQSLRAAIHSCYKAMSTTLPNQNCKFPALWHITFHQAQAYSHKTDQLSRPPWYRAQNCGVLDTARKATRNRDRQVS